MSMNQAVDQLASRVKLLEQDIDRIAMYLANKYPDERIE